MHYLLKNRVNKKVGNNIECQYNCGKVGHTTWNFNILANDVLKGKIRDKEEHSKALTEEEP